MGESHLKTSILLIPPTYPPPMGGGPPAQVRQTWKSPSIVETRLAKLYLNQGGIDVVIVPFGGEETWPISINTTKRQ